VSLRAELVCRVGGELLEGPCWDDGRLLLVDILRGERLALPWPGGELVRVREGEACSAWIPRRGGGSVLACRGGVRLLDRDGALERTIAIEADRPGNRSNDAKCDPRGRLWVGTMADAGDVPDGALYRLDGAGITRVLHRVTISNGLGWSPDGARMYYVDSPTRRIDVLDYDVATGEASDRRPLADVGDLEGVPDGLAVDAEGCLWVAFHDGAAVHRIAPDGERLASIAVPAARPTSCAFVPGGLAITTAAAPDGTGGDLYLCDVGVAGLPVGAYA
jgi:sugar lactone lactonase YvrE